MANEKILIVDDEIINLQLLEGLLEDSYSIIMALDGENALQKAVENNPDIILLDIMMPKMDGFEVCRWLKGNALTKSIPVIFVSARDTAEDKELSFHLGAVDYICKPILPDEIQKRIALHIEAHQLLASKSFF